MSYFHNNHLVLSFLFKVSVASDVHICMCFIDKLGWDGFVLVNCFMLGSFGFALNRNNFWSGSWGEVLQFLEPLLVVWGGGLVVFKELSYCLLFAG